MSYIDRLCSLHCILYLCREQQTHIYILAVIFLPALFLLGLISAAICVAVRARRRSTSTVHSRPGESIQHSHPPMPGSGLQGLRHSCSGSIEQGVAKCYVAKKHPGKVTGLPEALCPFRFPHGEDGVIPAQRSASPWLVFSATGEVKSVPHALPSPGPHLCWRETRSRSLLRAQPQCSPWGLQCCTG